MAYKEKKFNNAKEADALYAILSADNECTVKKAKTTKAKPKTKPKK